MTLTALRGYKAGNLSHAIGLLKEYTFRNSEDNIVFRGKVALSLKLTDPIRHRSNRK